MILIVRMSYYRCSRDKKSLNLCKVDLGKNVAYHAPTKFSDEKEFCVEWNYTLVWSRNDYLRVSPRLASPSWELKICGFSQRQCRLLQGYFYHSTSPSSSPPRFLPFLFCILIMSGRVLEMLSLYWRATHTRFVTSYACFIRFHVYAKMVKLQVLIWKQYKCILKCFQLVQNLR